MLFVLFINFDLHQKTPIYRGNICFSFLCPFLVPGKKKKKAKTLRRSCRLEHLYSFSFFLSCFFWLLRRFVPALAFLTFFFFSIFLKIRWSKNKSACHILLKKHKKNVVDVQLSVFKVFFCSNEPKKKN